MKKIVGWYGAWHGPSSISNTCPYLKRKRVLISYILVKMCILKMLLVFQIYFLSQQAVPKLDIKLALLYVSLCC